MKLKKSNRMNVIIYSATCILSGVFCFAGCTINVNQNANVNQGANTQTNTQNVSASNNAATNSIPAATAHWNAVICSSRINTVTLSAGPSKNDSDVFATYISGAEQKSFALPARVQNLSSIYLKASGSEAGQVELCVLYDGQPKKRIAFDQDGESDVINSSDKNDKDCRCVQ